MEYYVHTKTEYLFEDSSFLGYYAVSAAKLFERLREYQ